MDDKKSVDVNAIVEGSMNQKKKEQSGLDTKSIEKKLDGIISSINKGVTLILDSKQKSAPTGAPVQPKLDTKSIEKKLDGIISSINKKNDKKGLEGKGKQDDTKKKLEEIVKILKESFDPKKSKKNEQLDHVAKGLGAITASALKIAQIPPNAKKSVINFLDKLLSTFEQYDGEKIRKNTDSLVDVSKGLMQLGATIAIFGVTMIAFGIALPLIMKGTIGFGIVLAALTLSILTVNTALNLSAKGGQMMGVAQKSEKETGALTSLKQIGYAISIFGLTMAAFGIMAPLIKKGVVSFGITLGALTLSILAVNSVLNLTSKTGVEGQDGKYGEQGALKSLKHLGFAIAIFGLTMAGFGLADPLIKKGVLSFGLVLTGVTLAILMVGSALNLTTKGENQGLGNEGALKGLRSIGFSILLFGATVTVFGLASPLIMKGVGSFAIVLGALTLSILAVGSMLKLTGLESESTKGEDSMNNKGALGTLKQLGYSILMFGGTMIVFGLAQSLIMKGVLSFGIVLGALTLAVLAVGSMLKLTGLETESKSGEDTVSNKGAMGALKQLGNAVLFFGVLMIGFGLAQSLVMKGVGSFAIVLGSLVATIIGVGLALKVMGSGEESKGALGTLKSLGIAIAIFGVTMIGFGLALPLIKQGVGGLALVLVGVTIAILGMSLALAITGGQESGALKNLKDLGIAIAIFGITMVAFSFVLPMIAKGALGFAIVVAGLALAVVLVGLAMNMGPKDATPMKMLKGLLLSVAFTGLIMIGFSFALPMIAIGALGFVLVVGAISLSIVLMSLALGKKGENKLVPGGDAGVAGKGKAPGGKGPLADLTKLAWASAFLMIVMVGVGFFAKQAAIGALVTILTVMGLGLALKLVSGKNAQSVREGAISLVILGGAVGAFAAGLAIYAQLAAPKLTWENLAMLGLSIVVMATVGTIMGNMGENVKSGAISLVILGGALAAFATGLAIYSNLAAPNLTWENLAMLGTTIVVVSGIGMILGIPTIAPFMMTGATTLVILGAALATFAAGLAIYSNLAAPGLTWENLAMLGTVIGTVALVGSILGIPTMFIFAGLGAIALIALGGALAIFSVGLGYYTKIADGLTNESVDVLSNSIWNIGKAVSKIGLLSIPIGLGSLVLGTMGIALYPISKALAKFKEIEWTKENATSMQSALKSVTKGFSDALEGVSWPVLFFGVASMSKMGVALNGIAEGIQAFANLTFNEYTFDKESGRLVLTNKVKLTDEMIVQTGENIGKVISAILTPLSEFGEMMMGDGDKKKFKMKKKAMTFGIDSMANIGKGLVRLSQGVQDWANMTITEWDVQKDPNTGLNTLVPKSRKVMSSTQMTDAADNIVKVLEILGGPIADFGSLMLGEATSGRQFKLKKKSIEFGISSFATIGKGLVDMADAIVRWSNLQYFEMGIGKDKNTGLNVLMPVGKPKTITITEIDKAGENISKVLTTLAEPIAQFGDIFNGKTLSTKTGKKIKKESIITGIEQMGNIGTNLNNIAEMVSNWSMMKYTEMEVVKDKDGNSRIQPKNIVKIENVSLATTNIKTILESLSLAIAEYGEKSEEIEKSVKALNLVLKMQKPLGEWIDFLMAKFKDEGPKTSAEAFKDWLELSIDTTVLTYAEKSNDITRAVDSISYLTKMQKPFGQWVEFITKTFSNGTHVDSALNLKMWLTHSADPILEKMEERYKGLGNSIDYFGKKFKEFDKPVRTMAFTKFTDNILKLANIANPFEKFAKSFDNMAKSMGDFATNFLKMSPQSIESYTEFTNSLSKFVQMDPKEFKAKLDLVSKAFGVDDKSGQTPPEKIVDTPAGAKMNALRKPDDQLKADAKGKEGASPDTQKIIDKLGSVEKAVNRLAGILQSGLEVSASKPLKVTNVD